MKHLKVKAELRKDGRVRLSIIEQTHYAKEFGNGSPYRCTPASWTTYGDCAFTHNGTSLVSHPAEDFRTSMATAAPWLLVPLSEWGIIETTVTLEEWKWIKPLIEAYNEWGKDQ